MTPRRRSSDPPRGKRCGRGPKATPSPESVIAALESVIDETRRLFHRMRVAAEQVHRQGGMSGGRRGVLRDLDRLGPQTVPQMARARPVSRQHIQTLVDQLAAEGHVEFVQNPAHKRSHLIRLTRKGKELVEAMNRREAKILPRLRIGIPEHELRTTAASLRVVRELLESDQWKRLVKSAR